MKTFEWPGQRYLDVSFRCKKDRKIHSCNCVLQFTYAEYEDTDHERDVSLYHGGSKHYEPRNNTAHYHFSKTRGYELKTSHIIPPTLNTSCNVHYSSAQVVYLVHFVPGVRFQFSFIDQRLRNIDIASNSDHRIDVVPRYLHLIRTES